MSYLEFTDTFTYKFFDLAEETTAIQHFDISLAVCDLSGTLTYTQEGDTNEA